MAFDKNELSTLVAEHGVVSRIVIVEIKGSTPRDVGTYMYVWAKGQSGTIGGGALELEATRAARERLTDGQSGKNRDYSSSHPLGPALGQCCGGYVKLWTEVYEEHRIATLSEPFVARSYDGSLTPSLGVQRSLVNLRNGEQTLDRTLIQDGWIIEPNTLNKRPLWIWGAGHVGRALVSVLADLPDFGITWVDTAQDRFPDRVSSEITILPAHNPSLLMSHAPKQALHLILTYSHALDLDLCHHALRHGFAYCGVIGSDTKWARFRRKLLNLGHSEAEIDRITCPIGQPALGKHPQQIAIGVALELLQAPISAAQERKNIA